MKRTWTTISSVSGDGYGYQILRDDSAREHAVLLTTGGPFISPTLRGALVPAESYSDACDIGDVFCHCWHQWQRVQRRARAIAQGFAVLG